ncbi:MAG: HAMP domain-containing protein [Gammaproteobacteria bacterium]|nr:HAMP domain-containing protein [Gammaproteobacteria bacterium]
MKHPVRSFRLRMFVVTTLTVASVLACVALVSGYIFYAYEIRRLDVRLCAEGWRLAQRPPRADEVERFARDVAGKLRLQSTDQLLLERRDGGAGGAVVFGHWPQDVALQQLAWSDAPARSAPVAPPGGPPPRPSSKSGANEACLIASFDVGGSTWRVVRVQGPDGEGVVAASVAAIRAELWAALQRIALIAAPIALLLTALGAWLLSGLALRPVDRLRDAMKSVHERALDQRLSMEHEDREFRELIASYNQMLERLEASFNQASRFSADAAHELKTPLTILRGQIERAIPKARDAGLQQDLADVLDEVGRLASISRKLLLLSQADAGRLALLRTEVDLGEMLNERIADAQMLDLDATLAADVGPGLRLQADEQLLGQVLNNVLGNAIRYTPPGGRIDIRARSTPASVEVFFANTVRGLSPGERARFFERFYRGDAARNRRVDGHGLGLSLSRVIARAHGGDLTLEPSGESEVVLKLTLPRAGSNTT